jgi:hypothetical protein
MFREDTNHGGRTMRVEETLPFERNFDLPKKEKGPPDILKQAFFYIT